MYVKYECSAIGDRTRYPGGLFILQFHLVADHEGRQAREHPYGRIFKLKLELSTSISTKRIIYIHKNNTKMKLLILSGLASSWKENVCFFNLRIFLELKTDYIDAGDSS